MSERPNSPNFNSFTKTTSKVPKVLPSIDHCVPFPTHHPIDSRGISNIRTPRPINDSPATRKEIRIIWSEGPLHTAHRELPPFVSPHSNTSVRGGSRNNEHMLALRWQQKKNNIEEEEKVKLEREWWGLKVNVRWAVVVEDATVSYIDVISFVNDSVCYCTFCTIYYTVPEDLLFPT